MSVEWLAGKMDHEGHAVALNTGDSMTNQRVAVLNRYFEMNGGRGGGEREREREREREKRGREREKRGRERERERRGGSLERENEREGKYIFTVIQVL